MSLIDLFLFYLSKWKKKEKKIWFFLNTESFTSFIDVGDSYINILNFE